MARRPLSKVDEIASTAASQSTEVSGPPGPSGLLPIKSPPVKFKKAALFQVDSNGNIINKYAEGRFLINPDSIDEVKSSNWVTHTIPGQSDPTVQWVSGGPRTVSFEALITQDTRYYTQNKPNPMGALAGQAFSALGSIASAFAGVNVPLGSLLQNTPNTVYPTIKLDISRNLDYYRSLLYPTYNGDYTQLVSSPPLLVLYYNTALGANFTSEASGAIDPYADLWVLVDLNIKITKHNPDLTPMEATVGIKLLQYTIVSRDGSDFGFK